MYAADFIFKFLKVVLASKMNNGLLAFIDTVAWTRILKRSLNSTLVHIFKQSCSMRMGWFPNETKPEDAPW